MGASGADWGIFRAVERGAERAISGCLGARSYFLDNRWKTKYYWEGNGCGTIEGFRQAPAAGAGPRATNGTARGLFLQHGKSAREMGIREAAGW